MLPEIIRICFLYTSFVILVVMMAVGMAYTFGNTENFDDEVEVEGPWGKYVKIVPRNPKAPTFFGGKPTPIEQEQLDMFYKENATNG